MLVDFHCHLDLDKDYKALVKKAVQQDVFVLSVCNSPDYYEEAVFRLSISPNIKIGLGIHPLLVKDLSNASLQAFDNRYQLTTGGGENLTADAVVLAIPAYTAADLIRDLAPSTAEGLDDIRYVSTGTISLAFRRQDVALLEGFGLVIPRSERRLINAVTVTSTKFDGRAPADHVLLRVFFWGSALLTIGSGLLQSACCLYALPFKE